MIESKEGEYKEVPILTIAELQLLQVGEPEDAAVQKLLEARGIELSDQRGAIKDVIVDGLPMKMSVYKEDLGTLQREM